MKQNNGVQTRAVGLISGGLDSTLAAKIICNLGIDVHAVYFSMPWGCCNKDHAQKAAQKLGIKFIVLQLDERYLEIVRKPKYGYGRALNPCVDCRIHMFSRAAQYMRHIKADFVFTGEVLGQRPKSQKRHSMNAIENATGLKGRLLRPLSAHLLEPTIPELEGKVDRAKLLSLEGRSRKPQYRLAAELGIDGFPNPAGGCSLTDDNFARRMKDTLDYGYRNFRETITMKWGRHFRFDRHYKVIVGRDEAENEALIRYAHKDDIILQLTDELGPTAILKGNDPSDALLAKCAGIIQHYSRYRHYPPVKIKYWFAHDKSRIFTIDSEKIIEDQINQIMI